LLGTFAELGSEPLRFEGSLEFGKFCRRLGHFTNLRILLGVLLNDVVQGRL